MKELTYTILIIIFILFELTVVPRLAMWGVRPNFILMAILSWFILTDVKEALKWLAPCGIILDIFSPLPFGVITLSLLVTLFTIWLISQKVFSEKKGGTVVMIVILGTLFYNIMTILLTRFFTFLHLNILETDFTFNLKYFLLPMILYNLVTIFFLYRILKGVNVRLKTS